MRLPPWLWKLLASRKTKIALACSPFALCLLVLGFYFGTSWWGRSQAKRLLHDYESAGYAVDPEKYWHPPANPQDDLFQDPVFQEELKEPRLIPLVPGQTKISVLARRLPKAESGLARVTDLVHWVNPPASDERTAAELLLKEHHAAVERLEALRPVFARSKEAVWPVAKVGNELVGGIEFSSVAASILKLRYLSEAAGEIAILHLAMGDGEKAVRAGEVMLDCVRLELGPKPALTSILIADFMLRRAQAVIWEGTVRGVWNDGELEAFDEALAALRPQEAVVKSRLGEIAHFGPQTKWTVSHFSRALPKVRDDWKRGWEWDWDTIWNKGKEIATGLRPPGFELAEGVKSQRQFLEGVAYSHGAARKRFTPQDLTEFRRMSESSSNGDSIYFFSSGRILSNSATSALRMEATIALTRTGIALERYRLGKGDGKYPPSLEALIPAFLPELPMDPLSDQPLHYQVQADGSPHLWSVAGNLTDDGGRPNRNFAYGDFVWITRPIPGFTARDFSSP